MDGLIINNKFCSSYRKKSEYAESFLSAATANKKGRILLVYYYCTFQYKLPILYLANGEVSFHLFQEKQQPFLHRGSLASLRPMMIRIKQPKVYKKETNKMEDYIVNLHL